MPLVNFERIAGVDGFRGGWIAAIGTGRGATTLERYASFNELLNESFKLIVIDIPIGLPTAPRRICDVEARRIIQQRRNSVFPAPIREMLTAADYPAACDIRAAMDGKRCSKQLFAILPKIREVDALMNAELQGRVRE